MPLSLGAVSASINRTAKKLHFWLTNQAADITTGATGDIVVMYDASDNYEPKYADSANVFELMGITASAATINNSAAGTRGVVSVPDAATYTVLAADSGKRHIIPDLTASCTFTLPAGATGLDFNFVSNAVAADAQNWVFTSPAGVFYRGGVAFADNDAGAGADEIHAGVYPNGSSHVTLTIVTPAAGTYLDIFWDGTRYVVNGWVNSATVPAFS